MKLSNQALGALMLALQKSLLEQSDIVPVLQNFEFFMNEEGKLSVSNPPTVDMGKLQDFDQETDDEDDEYDQLEVFKK